MRAKIDRGIRALDYACSGLLGGIDSEDATDVLGIGHKGKEAAHDVLRAATRAGLITKWEGRWYSNYPNGPESFRGRDTTGRWMKGGYLAREQFADYSRILAELRKAVDELTPKPSTVTVVFPRALPCLPMTQGPMQSSGGVMLLCPRPGAAVRAYAGNRSGLLAALVDVLGTHPTASTLLSWATGAGWYADVSGPRPPLEYDKHEFTYRPAPEHAAEMWAREFWGSTGFRDRDEAIRKAWAWYRSNDRVPDGDWWY